MNKVPKGVVLQLTKQCNYKCNHCSQSSFCVSNHLEIKELTTEEWFSALDRIKLTGCDRVLFSGGEVFLRTDIRKICEYAKKIGFEIAFVTNGTLIEQNIDWISVLNPLSIRLSIYSIYQNKYEEITNIVNSYQNALKALQILGKKNLNTIIYFVLTNDNYCEISDLVKIVSSFGIYNYRFLQLTQLGRAKNLNKDFISLEHFMKFWQNLKELKSSNELLNFKLTVNTLLLDFLKEQTNLSEFNFNCNLGIETNWFINYKGEVFTCCILANESNLKIFNIIENDFENWHSWRHDKVFNLFNSKNEYNACYIPKLKVNNDRLNLPCQLTYINVL